MTIVADRRLKMAMGDRLPVDAGLILFTNFLVALAASLRDGELAECRLRVDRRINAVRAMAIDTGGRLLFRVVMYLSEGSASTNQREGFAHRPPGANE